MASQWTQDSLKSVPLNRNHHAAFEAFLSLHHASIIYYSLRYKRFLELLLECEPRYWLAEDESGHIVGILPIMKAYSKQGRSVLNSLPFYGSHGGILAQSPEAFRILLNNYRSETAADDVVAATMVENPLEPLDNPVPATFVDWRISQITQIGMPEHHLLASFAGSARRNINKAARHGVIVRVDNDAWDFLERVHRENMQAIGGTPKDRKFFEILPAVFDANIDYKIYVAQLADTYVAALLLLYYGDTVEYFVPATKLEARSLQPLSILIHDAMIEAGSAGFERWNWGGTWLTQTGVHRFKKKFGAIDRKYRYFTQLRDRRLLKQSADALRNEFSGFYVLPFDKLENPRSDLSLGA